MIVGRMRAWKQSERGKSPIRMTIFTLDTDSGEVVVRTHDDWMNWAPYPTPDGKHYIFVRPLLDNPIMADLFTFVMDMSSLDVGHQGERRH